MNKTLSSREKALANLKPFVKGDSRINRTTGPKNAEAKSFGIRFAEALATGGDPNDLAAMLWEKAMRGQPWAVEIILDRAIGKPKENEGKPVVYCIKYVNDPTPEVGENKP